MSDLPIDPDVEVPPSPSPSSLLREHAGLLPSIAVGGAAGSLARWSLDQVITGSPYPWATFVVNALGCLLLGLLMAFVEVRPRPRLRPLLGVGFLGGFTTFSTFELETRGLLASSHGLLAIVYVVASISLGLLAALGGLLAGRRVAAR